MKSGDGAVECQKVLQINEGLISRGRYWSLSAIRVEIAEGVYPVCFHYVLYMCLDSYAVMSMSSCIFIFCTDKRYDGIKAVVMCPRFVMAGDIIVYCGSIWE